MTATDDYSKVVRGAGPLKLKGVKGAKVEKKRKKTPSVDKIPSEPRSPAGGDVASEPKDKDVASFKEPGVMKDGTKGKADDRPRDVYKPRKTEAELRHEEMRRRRLQEKVEKEGTKTHKQRVEDFNKHLSKLTEHNDMPRIGPG